jgi:Uma2 family endonuclease
MYLKYPQQQTDPPRPPWETLPTMYDLPSENAEDSGLPDVGASPSRDVFHDLQPQLLSATFRLQDYTGDRIFTGTDLNLYYDVHHQLWYKRPDWFGVVGIPRLYRNGDLRLSYVIWQEVVRPAVVVELLSPGTEKEDLGQTPTGQDSADAAHPPSKWQVYEQILQVPYYVVFDRYTNQLRAFQIIGRHYEPMPLPGGRLWIPELKVGLGLWQGTYLGIERQWLRWFAEDQSWILTPEEQALQALSQEQQRAARLATKLRSLGIDPEDI